MELKQVDTKAQSVLEALEERLKQNAAQLQTLSLIIYDHINKIVDRREPESCVDKQEITKDFYSAMTANIISIEDSIDRLLKINNYLQEVV